jgi:hypothetical protein
LAAGGKKTLTIFVKTQNVSKIFVESKAVRIFLLDQESLDQFFEQNSALRRKKKR